VHRFGWCGIDIHKSCGWDDPLLVGEVGDADADAVNKGVSGDEGELSPFAQSGSRVGLRSIMSRGQKRENGWRGRVW
jgi:hypothetical protein